MCAYACVSFWIPPFSTSKSATGYNVHVCNCALHNLGMGNEVHVPPSTDKLHVIRVKRGTCAAAFLDPHFEDLNPFVSESQRKDVQEC